ncbi:hypothetical protein CP532_4620 [Ophiocordyceps camponoti-leonardi (nom. inval.)]|nr:hypothetical protein CP532_4620 [Ophiocordyceps camponoti-leonardi (nom. inval.)]
MKVLAAFSTFIVGLALASPVTEEEEGKSPSYSNYKPSSPSYSSSPQPAYQSSTPNYQSSSSPSYQASSPGYQPSLNLSVIPSLSGILSGLPVVKLELSSIVPKLSGIFPRLSIAGLDYQLSGRSYEYNPRPQSHQSYHPRPQSYHSRPQQSYQSSPYSQASPSYHQPSRDNVLVPGRNRCQSQRPYLQTFARKGGYRRGGSKSKGVYPCPVSTYDQDKSLELSFLVDSI